MNGQRAVRARKLARQKGDLFVPLTAVPAIGLTPGPSAGSRASEALTTPPIRGARRLPRPVGPEVPGAARRPPFTALTVALSGRVLALERAGGGVLWGAERQAVVRIDRPAPVDRQQDSRSGAAIAMIPAAASLSSPLPDLAIRGRSG